MCFLSFLSLPILAPFDRTLIFFAGPGLAIRVICAEQPYICDLDVFLATQQNLSLIANLAHCDDEVGCFKFSSNIVESLNWVGSEMICIALMSPIQV